MSSMEKVTFYQQLVDSLPYIWTTVDVDATNYLEENSIPSLSSEDMIHIIYRQKVNDYNVTVDYINKYDDIAMGHAIIHFTQPGHSFDVYCDEFSDVHFVTDETDCAKVGTTINLSKVKPGAQICLDYIRPKPEEFLSDCSPFYFKDMDFDGEDELVVNNIGMETKGHNTYDVFKFDKAGMPQRLKGAPFVDGTDKMTDYGMKYEPQTKSIVKYLYDGAYCFGYYRYNATICEKGLRMSFYLEEAEIRGYNHLSSTVASDTITLLQPYRKYTRIDGTINISGCGVYEIGNYGRTYNDVVLKL